MTPDVVVIGGGPAGLSAAIVIARAGVRTLLVEREAWPIDKPCGEGLLPNAVEALTEIGVDRRDLVARGAPISGISYFSARGRSAAASFPGDGGIGLSRVDLSALLVACARRLPALKIVTARARVERDGRGAATTLIDGTRLTPRLIVAADGLDSPTRRALGLPVVIGRHRRWGLRRHFGGEAWTSQVEVYFGDGVEAYVTPLRGAVNVACLWTRSALDVPAQTAAFDFFVSRIPALQQKLRGRRALDRVRAAGPFHRRPSSAIAEGVIFAGDAAGYLDAITGEGVGLALHHAVCVGETVVPALTRSASTNAVPRSDLERYARRIRSDGRPNAQLTRLLLALARRPAMVERVIAALSEDPGLFTHCLLVNMGQRPLWQIPPANLLRLSRALFLRRQPPVAE